MKETHRFGARAKGGMRGAVFFLAVFAALQPAIEAHSLSPLCQSAAEQESLEPGRIISRKIEGNQAQSFQINIAAGQYLKVFVGQRGINVVVTIFDPAGKKIEEESNPEGLESVSILAESTGSYRLEVRSAKSEAPPGLYTVKIEDLRTATDKDIKRISARRISREGARLQAQGTADSRAKAIEKYKAAASLFLATGDRKEEADSINGVGYIYHLLGNIKEALPYYDQALTIRRAIGYRRGEAETLNSLCSAYNTIGEKEKALDYCEQSLVIFRGLIHFPGQAVVLNNIGSIHRDNGDLHKAIEIDKQSLKLRRLLRDLEGEATSLNNLGVTYKTLGETGKALEHYLEALRAWRAADNRAGEASTLANIGDLYQSIGESQKAFDHYKESLKIRRAMGNRDGEAAVLHNLACLYQSLGEEQTALDYYNLALPLWRSVPNPHGETYTINNIGAIYESSGQKQEALKFYNQALEISRMIGDRNSETLLLNNIGWVYYSLGDTNKALETYNRALSLAKEAGYRNEESNSLNNIGLALEKKGESRKALELFNQALRLKRDCGNLKGEAATFYNLARLESKQNNFDHARRHIESAIEIIEDLRTKIGVRELRASYFATVQDFYQLNIDTLMQIHRERPGEGLDRLAFQVSEKARARSLLEIIAESGAQIRQGVDPALLERERALRQLLNGKVERELRLRSEKPTEEQKAEIDREIRQITAEYREILTQIRLRHPRYAEITQSKPRSFEEIQQALDAKTILLEYSLGEERSYLWLVSQSSILSFDLPPIAEIEAAARRFYDLLTAHNSVRSETPSQLVRRRARADAELSQVASQLGRMLLGKAADRLGSKRLLIVADGALQYVPFAALADPMISGNTKDNGRRTTDKYQPLFVSHEIVSLPSASTLVALRSETARRSAPPKTVAVIADPVFDANDPRVKKSQADNNRPQPSEDERWSLSRRALRAMAEGPLPRLAFTREEAESIIALAPAGSWMKALDFDSNRKTVTDIALGQYRFVVFATHGLIDAEHPELSGIVLSLVDERGNPQEGFLGLGDIYNLSLPVEMVTLSACRTALGKEVRGEGLTGLTRGFMYAGAKRVVASLWNVEDFASSQFMKRFYDGILREGLSPAAALRSAQREMWQKPQWRSPYYWAAFVLQGEWK